MRIEQLSLSMTIVVGSPLANVTQSVCIKKHNSQRNTFYENQEQKN